MLFNSVDFAIFLPIALWLFWAFFSKTVKRQNLFLVFVSYIFYGWWDWRFLGLIFFSSIVDFCFGYILGKTSINRVRKVLLFLSLFINLGLLGLFKYYNFFIQNFIDSFSFFGVSSSISTMSIVLPVGISFYTFQTISYTIDVYRGKLEPSKNLFSFLAYVSFFPQLVAGPIERASNLLPQFFTIKRFKYTDASEGLRQILWGLVKKIVIADNCATYANIIFQNSDEYSGSTLFLGAVFFAFQIYGDFSGYSDIAIGTAKLFGFKLMRNFAFPYFSRDIAEFWRRWHISLSTWFRDYLYIPLGGSKTNNFTAIRNIFIIFLVSGFWHGANWTFIFWGLLNACYFIPLFLLKKNRHNLDIVSKNKTFPSIKEFFQILATFGLTALAWIFFRAENLNMAFNIIGEIFSASLFSIPNFVARGQAFQILILVAIFIITEWKFREKEFPLSQLEQNFGTFQRRLIYLTTSLFIISFGNFAENEFIYFQF